ncbi:colicin E3/pyocin S6 family cytotoxin, partial [Actinosynnema sp. NPDC051121]
PAAPPGRPKPQGDAAPTGAQRAATDTVQAAAQTPTCSVPRLDPARQVPQPDVKQVEWAVQMAQQGLLTGSAYTRPAGFDNLGLAAYAPNENFPKIPLKHPAGDSWDSVPRSVFQAIMAQETNWSQASWHSLPGMTGGPLVADYYGAAGDIVSINYAGADCGYGLAQVTTGMRAGDGSVYSANGQKKIAVDYQENIAAGLQILQDTWNSLYDMGITANGGNPRYLENWYFAIWAYNSGVQPNAANGNTTGCTPGPACTGPHGTWGLGWTNNPANLDYPPTRAPFLKLTYDDAKHPSSWPYQERVLGWMSSPIVRFGSRAFANPDYHGGKTWVQPAPFTAFCTADDFCDPNATNPTNPGASHCLLDDFQCWWHQPVTWITDCANNCATSAYSATSGSTEPVVANPHPPTCSLDGSKVPTTGNGAPIVVDDQPSPALNLVGCGASNWSSNGTFSLAHGTNANGDPIGAIDTHQLGSGLGGRILFSHTQSGANPDLINTGTWTPNLPKLQYYKVKIHIPALGASATNVVYEINPGGGVSPWKIRVNQHWDSEEWVTIGTFAMQDGGNVKLSNRSGSTASTSGDLLNFDVAWDAVAFVPMGGTPGSPIGGPPGIIDAPKGSNPAFVQCGCVRRTEGDPVDTSTGYFGETFTDLSTPGRGMPLKFTRTYASALADPTGPNGALAVNGPFGWGWTFSYNLTAATDGATGNVTVRQEDGSAVTFVNTSGSYAPFAPRFDATLTKSGSNYTYTRRGKQVFTFDVATGRLTAETDVAGTKASPAYATTLTYDGSGHLSTINDPAGHKYTVSWTGNRITGLSDTAGRQVTYGYDTAGNLTDVYGVGTTRTPTLKNDDHMVFGYSANHLMTSMRTPRHYGSTATPTPVTSMTWDSADRVLTQTDPTGRTMTFTYGPNGGLQTGQVRVTDASGHKTVYTYTGGLLTAETRGEGTPDAGTWTYTYDPVTLGVSTISDPAGKLQTFTYDDHGNRTSASDGSGYTTSYQYGDAGDLISTIDPRGVRTGNAYDEAGHIPAGAAGERVLTSTTVAQLGQSAEIEDGNPGSLPSRTTNYYYDDAAHPADLTRLVDPRGNTTSFGYDSSGNRTSVTDPEGDRTLFGYDTGKGWRTSEVTPSGAAAGVTAGCTPPAKGCTAYGYDAWGNTTSTKDALGRVSSAVFDANGNRTSATDANNRTTTYGYDAFDRPTLVTKADNTTESTEYNPDGTVAATVDALTKRTTFGYDGQGRRNSRTDPDNRTTTGKLDPTGNLASTTDPLGQVITYGHDGANRIASITYSDGVTPNVTFGYNSVGARVSMTDGTGTTTWDADAFGGITGITRGSGAHVGYTYDNNGNILTIAYPGGTTQTVTRTFDKANRLKTVTDWNNNTTTFGYGADSELRTTQYPNGTTITNGYDNSTTLTSSTLAAGTTPLASLTYGRDNTHRLSSSTPVNLPGAATTYGYNAREQLGSATAGSTVTTYGLDAAGNPTGLGPVTQAFDPAGRLCWTQPSGAVANPTCATVPSGATAYTFNDRGDRTKRTPATGTATTYGYDQAQRLTSVTGAATATYRYDGDGVRTGKTAGGTTTSLTWGAGAPAPLLSDGTWSFVHGPDGPIAQVGSAGTQWFFHDQIGSTRALVNGSGTIVGKYGYTEYGVASRTGTATTPLQYTGQYTDAETGFVYLRARYYDPATAQFLTVDPKVGETGTPYSYVGGDPLNDLDPTGLCGFWCGALIGAAIVGTAACIVLEPCGVIAGAAVTAGGAVAMTSATVVVPATVVGAAAVGGLAGGAISMGMVRGPQYVPAPSNLPGFPDAKNAKGKTQRQGGGGTRKRWIDQDGCILEWDYQHGAVERYSPNGRTHYGEYDPETGEQIKPGEPGRRVEK